MKLFEGLLNRYLEADPEIANRLVPFTGKSFNLFISDLNLHFFIIVTGNRLKFLAENNNPDAQLTGRSLSFLQFYMSQSAPQLKAKEYEILIEGDVEFVEKIYEIFRLIDVDWEEKLSYFTGDFFAQQFFNFSKKTKKILKDHKISFEKNISEYLHEEVNLFPTKEEIVDWFEAVSVLKEDVERFEARFAKL